MASQSVKDEDWVNLDNDFNGMTIQGSTAIQSSITAAPKVPKKTAEHVVWFYGQVERNALAKLKNPSPIFHAEVSGEPLYDTFLNALPNDLYREYSCSSCRRFANKWGKLAQVDVDGNASSLFWSSAVNINEPFKTAVTALDARFTGCRVGKEFKVRAKTRSVGADENGGFRHFHMTFPADRLQKDEIKGVSIAATAELAAMLDKVLKDYKLSTVRRTVKILEEDKLPYVDNHKAAARWLLGIKEAPMPAQESTVKWHNFLSRTATMSFVGCLSQLRSGALSTLLSNIEANLSWPEIESQWKMLANPVQYLRPQAPPKAGNVLASERLFNELGLTQEDMRRRFLVRDDIPESAYIWRRPELRKSKPDLSIFGEVKSKPSKTTSQNTPKRSSDMPATSITFTKFITKILPKAKSLEVYLEDKHSLFFIITGLKGNKPLMQWHSDATNQASWYTYDKPRSVLTHKLKPCTWNKVTALIPLPHLWDGAPLTTAFPLDEDSADLKYYHKKEGLRYMFCVEGITEPTPTSLCLFPELLKGEFHGVRSTIEAYSNKMKKEFVDEADKKGGYIGGPVVGKSNCDRKKEKIRVTNWDEERGIYEIVLFD